MKPSKKTSKFWSEPVTKIWELSSRRLDRKCRIQSRWLKTFTRRGLRKSRKLMSWTWTEDVGSQCFRKDFHTCHLTGLVTSILRSRLPCHKMRKTTTIASTEKLSWSRISFTRIWGRWSSKTSKEWRGRIFQLSRRGRSRSKFTTRLPLRSVKETSFMTSRTSSVQPSTGTWTQMLVLPTVSEDLEARRS